MRFVYMTFSEGSYDNLIIVKKRDSIIIVTGIQRHYPIKNLIEEFEYINGKQYKLLATGSVRNIRGINDFKAIIRLEENVEFDDDMKKGIVEILEKQYFFKIEFEWR